MTHRVASSQQLETLAALLLVETDQCIDWPFAKFAGGYGSVQVDGKSRRAHVLACVHHHGPKPTPAHVAAHSCGRPPCINYRHLRWATHAENMADKLKHGTHNRGERHGMAKLRACDVEAIIRRFQAGEMQADLAAEFGVTQPTISRYVNRKRWSY